MDILFKLGISEIELKNIIDINNEILDFSQEEITSKIKLLNKINCTPSEIRNILITNPFYLSYSMDIISNMFQKLSAMGFTHLNLLYDANPFFFDYELDEIMEYIMKKQNEGLKLEDIITMIQDNPYLEM